MTEMEQRLKQLRSALMEAKTPLLALSKALLKSFQYVFLLLVLMFQRLSERIFEDAESTQENSKKSSGHAGQTTRSSGGSELDE